MGGCGRVDSRRGSGGSWMRKWCLGGVIIGVIGSAFIVREGTSFSNDLA